MKRTVDSKTGERKIIKLTFFEAYETSIGGVRIRRFRNPEKEGSILKLVKDHPSFMQGKAYLDEKGNVVRILDVVRGPNFLNYIYNHKLKYEDYFQPLHCTLLQHKNKSVPRDTSDVIQPAPVLSLSHHLNYLAVQ